MFIKDREIADPIVRPHVHQTMPKGQQLDMMLQSLKLSQKNMEYKMHPWMSPDIRDQIIQLEENEGKGRRSTIAHKDAAKL